MNVKIIVPEENMGDVLGDLNTRRARVMGMETEKGESIVSATVPLAEMQRNLMIAAAVLSLLAGLLVWLSLSRLLRWHLARNPRSAPVHSQLGEAFFAAGDRAAARAAWEESLRINGDQPEVRRRLEEATR